MSLFGREEELANLKAFKRRSDAQSRWERLAADQV